MRIYVVLFSLMLSTISFGQEKDQEKLNREAREHVRQGNKLYNQLKFDEAEVEYKKALAKNPLYDKAAYNLGNTVYNQDRNKEAVGQYQLVEKTATEKMSKAEIFHNKGNAFMNEKQYAQAIDAYKHSLRNNSKDDETRYNLALAKKLLEDQQNQNQNKDNKDNKDKNENKDKKKEQDQKEKEGGDEEKKEDKQDEKEQGKDKQDENAKDKKNEQQDKDKQEQKPNPSQLTPEQMKQLLEAMNNEENKTQKKLNAQKAKGKKVKQAKDW